MEGAVETGPAAQPRPPRTKREVEQAKRRRNRLLPLLVLAIASFGAGVYFGAGSPDKDAVERFMRAWADQDYAAMHEELTEEAAAAYPVEDLRNAYLATQQTATVTAINPGGVEGPSGDVVEAGLELRTTIFGMIEGRIDFPVSDGGIAWEPHLTFPGLEEGELLGRRLELSERAEILARDGTELAAGQGAERSSPLGTAAIDVTGEVGRPDTDQAAELAEQGLPPDEEVGISGLERAFNSRLAGKPGGELLAVRGQSGDVAAAAGGRTLASADAEPGQPVETTIEPALQEDTVAALGGQFGGAVVLDARNGEVLAMAGAAYSQPAPPGSTFKLITTVAALEEEIVELEDTFEVTDGVNVGGREIENSEGEFCGGTFIDSFANSCNTVFAPLGPEIGEDKLVETAEKFGWNQPPTLYSGEITGVLDLPMSEIPETIGDDLDIGVTAIGQGEVLATPLQMASVAQTIAAGGMRSPTAITTDPELAPEAKPVKVTTPQIARTVNRLMVNVVSFGTGQAAFISGTRVAGKTGTAELGPKPPEEQPPEIRNPKPLAPGEEPPKPEQILDAWFTAFAPAQKPKLVVCVFLANSDGDGGEVAAPIAREILLDGL